MRVCLVSWELASFTGGGIGTYVIEMAKAYANAGHEVHVISEAHEGLVERGPEVAPGVEFHAVRAGEGWAGADAYPTYLLRYSMGVYELLSRLHGEQAFDYIEFAEYRGEGYFATQAKRTLGRFGDAVIGVKLHTPTWLVRELNNELSVETEVEYMAHMERASTCAADVVLSPSTSLLGIVSERYGLSDERQVRRVVRNPLERSPLMEACGGGEGGVGDDDASSQAGKIKEILYYGRLEHRKGVQILVPVVQRMLARGWDIRLRMIGGDTKTGPFGRSMREHLRRMIGGEKGAWADRIVLEEAVPREQLGRAIRQAAVCCFPSIWENFPNVCLEAMSMGSVVVGSSAGGMGEMIEDGQSGFVFEACDGADLEAKLEAVLMLDDEQRARMGQAASARIARMCEPGAIVREMEEVIEAAKAKQHRESVTEEAGRDLLPVGQYEARLGVPGASCEKPVVSVIVPVYNLGAYLPECLDSLRRQTFRDFEVVIVDDGSFEHETLVLLDQLREEGWRVVRKPNGGLSSARNKGIEEARGDWVLPLDCDDVLHPTAIEKLVAVKRVDPELGVVTTLVRYFVDDVKSVSGGWGGWVPFGFDRSILAHRNCASNACALMDKRVIQGVGGYDVWLTSYEDWDLLCTLAQRGYRSAVIPEFLYYYRVRPASMMRDEGMGKHYLIKSYLAQKHPMLSDDPSWTLRMQMAEAAELKKSLAWYRNKLHATEQRVGQLEQAHARERRLTSAEADPYLHAQQIVRENIRYRVVDKMNTALKTVRLHRPFKATVRAVATAVKSTESK